MALLVRRTIKPFCPVGKIDPAVGKSWSLADYTRHRGDVGSQPYDMQKLKRSRRLDRDDAICKNMQPFIDRLFELYKETDPGKGETSEPNRLMRAQQAIRIWSRIYGKLLLWAQNQIVGYEIRLTLHRGVDFALVSMKM